MNPNPPPVSARRDPFAAVALAYLLLPSLIFFLSWLRPAIGVPAALVTLAAWGRFWRKEVAVEPRLRLAVMDWVYVLALAGLWTWLAGLGGFLPQQTDHEKHNLVFHDLLAQSWPVYYANDTGSYYLCYGMGFYLPPALAARWLGAAALPELIFLWAFAGIALFFYWVATFSRSPRKTLAIFLVFATTETLWHMFLHVLHGPRLGERGLAITDSLVRLGVGSDYSDSWMSLQFRPQHVLSAWLGAALFYELFWRRKSARGSALVWAAGWFWSPLMSLGLLLVPFTGWKRWRGQGMFEPVNIGGALLLAVLAVYFQGHVVLTEVGPIWKFGTGANWLVLAPVFLLLQLTPMLFLYLADCKYDLLGELRPLFRASFLLLLLLPLYKIGYYGDLRMQAGTTALVFSALAASRVFQHSAFSLRRPLFALLLATQLVGAAYPFGKWWMDCLTGKAADYSFTATQQRWGYHNLSEFKRFGYDYASQYLGRTNSPAAKWLLRSNLP